MHAALTGGSISAVIAGVFGLISWQLGKAKLAAEIRKLDAEKEKTEAETDSIVSNQLLKEIDFLLDRNKELGQELERLRRDVMEYAAREAIHAAENKALRMQLEQLQSAQNPVGLALQVAFPPVIEHQPNEFDDESAAGNDKPSGD